MKKLKENNIKISFNDLKLTKFNRAEIDPKHVNELTALIEKYGYLPYLPILALPNGAIIEGQHRYLACQRLGIECPFYIVDSIDLMLVLNTSQKPWKIDDYVNYFAELGNNEFTRLRDFCKIHNFSYFIGASVLFAQNAGGNLTRAVKQGKLIGEVTEELINAGHARAKQFIETINLMGLGNKDRLVKALISAIRHESFDLDKFNEKLKLQLDRIHPCNTKDNYLRMIENIYNYNSHGHNKITLVK